MLTPQPAASAAPAVSVRIEDQHTMSTSRPSPLPSRHVLDDRSRSWLLRLRSAGPEREQACNELRELLLRAARYEVRRRNGVANHLSLRDQDDLAQQAADDALLAILAKLNDYRGEARFTTWAYKFALLEAAVKLRRRAWQEREVSLDSEHWALISDRRSAPHGDTEASELIAAVRDAIGEALTQHQRQVLVAITLNDIPIDVLAERLNTTRGALYKTLHDARRKLRAHLTHQGFDISNRAESRTP